MCLLSRAAEPPPKPPPPPFRRAPSGDAAAEAAPAGVWTGTVADGFGFSKADSGDVCCCVCGGCLIGEKPEAAGMDEVAGGCCELGGKNPAAVAPAG